MTLNFKKAYSNVFSLKYLWIYIFFAAAVATLSSIFQSAKGIPYYKTISNLISVFTYIPIGYLLIMVNNLLHDRELNDNNETFLQNFWNSVKKGLKCFVGIFLNIIIVFLFSLIIALAFVWIFMAITHIEVNANNITSFPFLKIVLGLIATAFIICMLFILKLLPVAYADNFSLKAMFCWKKVFKEFFQKEIFKKTLAILGIYIAVELIIFLIMFLMLFSFNIALIFIIKNLLLNHYVIAALLINLSNVIVPFLGAIAHFILISIIYNMLADVYKK
ncbi:hypothetical protein IKE67_00915 [bacterium]|nr:hypothetical protein [bacterium]